MAFFLKDTMNVIKYWAIDSIGDFDQIVDEKFVEDGAPKLKIRLQNYYIQYNLS